MPLTTTGRNKLLDSGKSAFSHIGAVTDLSGTEVAGGSYARQAITFAAAASGIADNNAQITIPIPAGTTVVCLAAYDAASAGNRLSLDPWGSSGQVLKGVGTAATSDTITSNGHGLATDDRIMFVAVAGESLPTGLSATTLYFVRATGLTADAFTVATTSGGAAVDITAVGELAWFKTVPNTFASAGNIVLATGAYDLDLNFL